jgi:N-6 DNA Methylase
MAELVRYRKEFLTGDEKGEAQVFCDRLFRAFGHDGVREAGAILEMRLKKHDTRGTSFADLVWPSRCIIEMKKAGTPLDRHYRQAFEYWINAVPGRPQYVILCNFDELWIYDFDRQLDEPVDRVSLEDLPKRFEALSFLLPRPGKPVFGNDLVSVTRDAAMKVASLFRGLHDRGIPRDQAQRFALQSVMAMFSEDINLLPAKHFTRALSDASDGADAYDLIFGLFREMNTPGRTQGGRYIGTPYFNGGLFAKVTPFDLLTPELELLREAASTDWSAVRPEIFGTLFEQSMDEDERHAQGAHFTSQADIARVVIPTIVNPWRERLQKAGSIGELEQLLLEMYSYRVLDPACGSGNFLYVAYRELRRLESEAVNLIGERRRSTNLADQTRLSYVTPDHFFGIDVNPFAVEIAKVTLLLGKKLSADELGDVQQVLPLDNLDGNFVVGDALFTAWPQASVIVGNPPFLGRRKMVEELGAQYTQKLATSFPLVKGVSDYVCYWFPLVHDHLPAGGRAGLVATQSVRKTSGRAASLDYVVGHGGVIHDAVSSMPWSGDASVYVSIVNWSKQADVSPKHLWLSNGDSKLTLDFIPPSLSPDVDVATAKPLKINKSPKVCFQGQTPGMIREFTLNWQEVQEIRRRDPGSGKYIHPSLGGDPMLKDLSAPRDFIMDLPHDELVEAEHDAPEIIKRLRALVLPGRQEAFEKEHLKNLKLVAANPKARTNKHNARFLAKWWQLAWRRADMIDAIDRLDRYIALTITASWERPSVYQFVDSSVRPNASLQVFAFDDDYSFGILSSSIHRKWFEERCSRLKVDFRYTPTTVFDCFPWPQNPSESSVRRVVSTVEQIIQLRERYLERNITLGKQYDALREPGNSRLRTLHEELDQSVFEAYGFSQDDDVLTQLLALNVDISASQAEARAPGGAGLTDVVRTEYRLKAPLW